MTRSATAASRRRRRRQRASAADACARPAAEVRRQHGDSSGATSGSLGKTGRCQCCGTDPACRVGLARLAGSGLPPSPPRSKACRFSCMLEPAVRGHSPSTLCFPLPQPRAACGSAVGARRERRWGVSSECHARRNVRLPRSIIHLQTQACQLLSFFMFFWVWKLQLFEPRSRSVETWRQASCPAWVQALQVQHEHYYFPAIASVLL